MAPRGMLIVTTVLLYILLGLLTPAPAACSPRGRSCCTRYYKKQINFQNIKGYREQTSWENCRIKAIIFLTVRKQEICVNPNEKWVKNILKLLSVKLSKMSKDGSAAGETHTEKGVKHAFNDGSGFFLSTTETETYSNSTESSI